MKKPLISAHRGGKAHGKENSIEAVLKSIELGADIIELDVRRTKDNIIIARHGSILETLKLSRWTKNKTLEEIREKIPHISDLKSILKCIGEHCGVYLDIKDRSIRIKELIDILKDTNIKEVYIGTILPWYFKREKNYFPNNWKMIVNNIIFPTKRLFRRMNLLGVHIVEIIPWSLTEKCTKYIKKLGMEFCISGHSRKDKHFIKGIEWEAKWICIKDIERGKKLINKHSS